MSSFSLFSSFLSSSLSTIFSWYSSLFWFSFSLSWWRTSRLWSKVLEELDNFFEEALVSIEDIDLLHIFIYYFAGYYDNLKTHDSFDTEDWKEPATALLWLLYFLAQHHDHNKDFQKALETVDEAINHTPTLIELFMLKGKIFKHVGNLDEAVNCFDEAQSLDTADR